MNRPGLLHRAVASKTPPQAAPALAKASVSAA